MDHNRHHKMMSDLCWAGREMLMYAHLAAWYTAHAANCAAHAEDMIRCDGLKPSSLSLVQEAAQIMLKAMQSAQRSEQEALYIARNA